MKATIPMMLVSTVAAALAPASVAQEPDASKVGSRRPVDVSLEGLGGPIRRASRDGAHGGRIGVQRTAERLTPFDCIASINDQAAPGACLMASSTATLGLLFPYPGKNNAFVPLAFVGGGENNEALQPWCTIGGGSNNLASGTLSYYLTGYSTVAGGSLNRAVGAASTVGGGTNNSATLAWSTVGGGRSNLASGNVGYYSGYATVAGGVSNRATGANSTVGGGSLNTASGFMQGFATVGGGSQNTASSDFTTVAGGKLNMASTSYAMVGGGSGNTASGPSSTVAGGGGNTASGLGSTVAGGGSNTASGRNTSVGGGAGNTASADRATVGGGLSNTASGNYATVGGGRSNTAAGIRATVPGGYLNAAQGNHSFAAGRRAKANHNGAFVWGDTQNVDKPSSGPDEFNVYCRGGARFFSDAAFTTGVLLAPGGSTWTMVSDRNAKENVEPVDARAVLAEVARLPVATWNYKEQDDSIRHMGPMAQDFYAAFGLGLGEKTIDTIDPNGVALAAIQGLNAELEEMRAAKDAEIEELRAANEALLARVELLEARARAATTE